MVFFISCPCCKSTAELHGLSLLTLRGSHCERPEKKQQRHSETELVEYPPASQLLQPSSAAVMVPVEVCLYLNSEVLMLQVMNFGGLVTKLVLLPILWQHPYLMPEYVE